MIDTKNTNLLRLLLGLYCLFIVYIILSAVITFNSTGELNIVSTDKNANLVISQPNHQALQVGIGEAKLRLKPGSYQVSALDSGKQANFVVSVSKKHTSNITIGPLGSVALPTLKDVSFSGLNNLLNYGMPSAQLSGLEMALFKFSPNTKNISLSAGTVSFAPYNSASASTLSTVNFTVAIGSSNYNASLTYDNLGSYLDLKLYNPSSNTLLYDSNG